jgi:curli biogenesis system outer membrane secretion channel CsgG
MRNLLKQITVIGVFLGFFGCSLQAENVLSEMQVIGEGVTYKDALNDALTNALAQTKGVQLNSEEVHNTAYQEVSSQLDDQYSSESKLVSSTQGSVSLKTKGFIQNYEILDRYKNDSGLCEVVVSVKTSKYKTPGISPDNRRKLAVIPFRNQMEAFQFGQDVVPGDIFCRQYTQHLVNEFTQARKFSIVDREYGTEFGMEREYLKTDDFSIEEQAKLGQVLGVDYLVVGTIKEAYQKKDFYRVQLTGQTGYKYNASITVDYRIMVMATRQIKWSDSVTTTLGNNFFKEKIKASPSKSLTDKQIRDLLISISAKEVVNSAMDNIYPIRVAAIQPSGDIILNQGGISLEEGENLDLFSRGQAVIDPVTGESLGADETYLGTIVITRVNPKMSYARFVESAYGMPQVGDICRRVKSDPNKPNGPTPEEMNEKHGRESNVDSSGSGGVYLPFD